MNPLPLRLPKLCGGDLELGNFYTGIERVGGTAFEASRDLLAEIEGVVSRAGTSSPSASPWGGAGYATVINGVVVVDDSSQALSQDWGRKFLLNGGCCYVDLNHLEVCTPEVLSAFDYVAASHAMYRIADQAAALVNRRLEDGARVHVLANNSDGQGNSYGSHLNFLISRPAWENIFHRRLHHQLFLAAYQASSIVFTGLGKVGAENDAAAVPYQISQRADFLKVLSGPQTTFNRPLINSRDESLCGGISDVTAAGLSPTDMARLHVIFYDHNLCHAAGVLKVGVLQIILAMIEAHRVSCELLLEEPVAAVARWSHDPQLEVRTGLLSGGETTAVELQWRFFEMASGFVDEGGCEGLVPRVDEIMALWQDTLEKLEDRNFAALASRLDWVLKWSLLQQVLRQRPELDWEAPSLKVLDHLYSSLDPAQGLYWACERNGSIERLVTEAQIGRLMNEPPADTRAWLRGELLGMAGPDEIESVDWDCLRFNVTHPDSWQTRRFTLSMANPLAFSRHQMADRLPECGDLVEALVACGASEPGVPNTVGSVVTSGPRNSVRDKEVADADASSPS